MLLLVRYLVLGLRVLLGKRRLDVALENGALRHQLEVLARSGKRAPVECHYSARPVLTGDLASLSLCSAGR